MKSLRYAMETLTGVISALRAAPSRAHIRPCGVMRPKVSGVVPTFQREVAVAIVRC